MIDTIVLNLEWRKDFEIMEGCYKLFSPDVANFFKPPYVQFGTRKSVKADRNPTAKDKLNGNYMPRLTLIKAIRRGSIPIILNVEFSAPKIIFNDNFNEVSESDLDYLCVQLGRKLYNMGIIVKDRDTLKNAYVSAIHYAKNITLTDYSTAYEVLSEIEKCNYTTRKQLDRQKYRGGGEAVHFYSSKWGLCVYDKLNEHKRSKVSERGLLEKDNYCQLSLFDDSPLTSPFQMIRFEARYIGRPQIGKSLKEVGVTPESLTLRNLFKESIAKKMLKHELDKLRDTYPAINLSDKKPPQLVMELSVQNPKVHISTVFQALAYKTLIETTGSRDIRKMGNFSSQQWYNLNKKINSLNFTRRKLKSFDLIEEQLEKFIPIRLQRYLDK